VIKTDTKKLINIKQAIIRLKRSVAKCIYYNDDCFIKLRPIEMEHLTLILGHLYDAYLEHKDDATYKGMKHEELSNALIEKSKYKAQRRSTARSTVWLLIPQFVNVRSYGYKRDARKYMLNEFGIKLVETLLEEAKKPKPVTVNKQSVYEDDDDEFEDEEDEEEIL